MTTDTLKGTREIIIHIFVEVDDQMPELRKHPQAKLYPSELVTIGILFALKGRGFRAFYRWLKRDYDALFAGLSERTRLQRLLKAHQDWCEALLAKPSFFAVGDSYPIELLFPIRQEWSKQQVGKKGRDKGRWSVGIKFCWLLNDLGQVVGWDWAGMNEHDQNFHPLIECFARLLCFPTWALELPRGYLKISSSVPREAGTKGWWWKLRSLW